MPGSNDAQAYTLSQVCRLLGVSPRQLRAWQRQNLIRAADTFTFPDLIALRALTRLRQQRVRPSRIRRVLASVREKLRDVHDPLRELRIFVEGRKITVQAGPSRMEPVTGQLLLDFDRTELSKLAAFPAQAEQPSAPDKRRLEAGLWFEKALQLEQSGATPDAVIAAYKSAIELDPASVGAMVNLGTVYFHLQAWDEAERYYKQALAVDPGYALAHFNLGNLYDERQDRPRALAHYLMALRLNPRYADAHYNLALLYQTAGQIMRAVRHWKAYLKLDPDSPWAAIARQELDKLRRVTLVKGYEPSGRGPGAGSVT